MSLGQYLGPCRGLSSSFAAADLWLGHSILAAARVPLFLSSSAWCSLQQAWLEVICRGNRKHVTGRPEGLPEEPLQGRGEQGQGRGPCTCPLGISEPGLLLRAGTCLWHPFSS